MIVSIKPSISSNSFRNFNGSIEQVEEATTQDGRKVKTINNWNEKRFPNSIQKERPIVYSYTLKKWLLKSYEVNSPELNEMVKACSLINNKKNHPDFGRMIISCDIHDSNDPFFTHPDLYIRLVEGYGILNTDDRKEKLFYEGALKNNRFDIGGEDDNPYVQRRAKYILIDKNIDKKIKENTRSNTLEATKIFEAMSEDKLKTVALAMGVIRSKEMAADIVKDVLFEYVLDNKNKSNSSQLTKQEHFLQTSKMDADHLHIRNVVQLAFANGTIKRDKDAGFLVFGTAVGKTKDSVMNYFLDVKNSEILFRVEKAVNI
jgi:ribosomal protein S6